MPSENTHLSDPIPPTTEELDQRVREVAAILDIEESEVWETLEAMGVERSNANALELLTVADDGVLKDLLEDEGNIFAKAKLLPRKRAWMTLTRPSLDPRVHTSVMPDASAMEKLVDVIRPIEQWSDKELMEAYGPDCESRILNELSKRARDQTVIVFGEDGEVSVQASLELLRTSRRQKPPGTYLVDGKMYRTCRVGEFPQMWIEECPIHEDTILADGYCEKCGDTWKEVPDHARIVVRVAKMAGQIGTKSHYMIREAINTARSDVKDLLAIPKVGMLHRELREDDRLPRLRKRVSAGYSSADPFFVHRQY